MPLLFKTAVARLRGLVRPAQVRTLSAHGFVSGQCKAS
jgi:hypothetical protein